MTPSEPSTVQRTILQKATRLFVARGYHGLSMREIAEAVGVSKAALYYHFKDKEALFLAILTDNLESIEQIIQAARQQGTLRQQIDQMVHGIFQRAPEQRAIIRLASQEMGHLSEQARQAFGRLYREKFIDQVEAILVDGIARGELRPLNTKLATWILLGMMYPFLYPAHVGPLDSLDEVANLMVTIFLDGAASEG